VSEGFSFEDVGARAKGSGLTVGVFDSGFGGLTVLRALMPLLAGARFVYVGDTARLPYGSKSRETISRYALTSADFIQDQGADLLVVACNTATALALDDLKDELPIPVVGVIEPGAAAAKALKADAKVLVLATSATVQSGAYTRELEAVGLGAHEMACPLLVPLVEEGWTDTLLLGCTHYPLLEPAIRRTLERLGHPLTIIDSARATADATARLVEERFSALRDERREGPGATFYATDSVEKFQRLGSVFLGRAVDHVSLIDLGG